MDLHDKQAFIHRIAAQNRADPAGNSILWSHHGSTELANEGWHRLVVEDALQGCEVIEDYLTAHRPLPDCLVQGWLTSGQPFHAVVALDEARGRLFVVTVYRPAPEEWENDWRTRKQ